MIQKFTRSLFWGAFFGKKCQIISKIRRGSTPVWKTSKSCGPNDEKYQSQKLCFWWLTHPIFHLFDFYFDPFPYDYILQPLHTWEIITRFVGHFLGPSHQPWSSPIPVDEVDSPLEETRNLSSRTHSHNYSYFLPHTSNSLKIHYKSSSSRKFLQL